MRRDFSVDEGAAGERLDVSLATMLAVPRAQAQKLIKQGSVTVNGEPSRTGYHLRAGDDVQAQLPESASAQVEAPDLPVVYEDPDILVVDKPAGLTAHAGSGTAGHPTVADFARPRTSDPDAERPGIVHRLDRDTSGLMVIAKSAEAKAVLQKQFQGRQVRKTYLLLVVGRPRPAEAEIRLPVGRHPRRGLRQTISPAGRQAVTRYRTLAEYPGYSYVEASPETGRTHQLRVHFAALGHPVAGDTTYGHPRRQLGLRRQFLHAASLGLTTPSGKAIMLTSPLPADLERVLKELDTKV